jgi:hypothetical protein
VRPLRGVSNRRTLQSYSGHRSIAHFAMPALPQKTNIANLARYAALCQERSLARPISHFAVLHTTRPSLIASDGCAAAILRWANRHVGTATFIDARGCPGAPTRSLAIYENDTESSMRGHGLKVRMIGAGTGGLCLA